MYKLCIAFSVRRNFLDLPKAEESNPALHILYGTRTFCILMIIMDHRFGTYLSGPLINFDYIEKVKKINCFSPISALNNRFLRKMCLQSRHLINNNNFDCVPKCTYFACCKRCLFQSADALWCLVCFCTPRCLVKAS